jgi:hypothetical protein
MSSSPSNRNFRKVIESFHFFSQPLSSILPPDEDLAESATETTPETTPESTPESK